MSTCTKKLTPAELATSMKTACDLLGWKIVRVHDTIITIQKEFPPESFEEFTTADMEYGGLLDMIPFKGGSIWGTDGGGIGALSAVKSGRFVMNKSGNGGKRFAQALNRIVFSGFGSER